MVRLVVWIVIGVLALSFFGVSLKGLIEDPTTKENFSFIFDLVEDGWDIAVEHFQDWRDDARSWFDGSVRDLKK